MKKNKIIIIIVSLIIIVCSSLGAYYFGAYSFYHKIFPFSASKKVIEENDFKQTAYNFIKLKSYNTPNYGKYGGIDFLLNELIYVEGDGSVYILKKKFNDKFTFKKVKSEKIPNNRDKFINKYQETYGEVRMTNFFGVRDIYIDKFDSEKNKDLLIVSSLDYDVENDCHRLAVFSNQFVKKKELELKKWQKIFTSKTCLDEDVHIDEKFPLSSAGGRIVKFDENHILMSIGDYAVDGYYSTKKYSQDLSNDYGKIIKIKINDSSSEIFSYGHRNPQGLFFLDKENIFSTEHGPNGGDELNIIYKDKNYGWPLATFGTAYYKYSGNHAEEEQSVSFEWPNEITDNSHSGFEKPIYSWGPRWGVSNLIVYKSGTIDKRWKGNLFISSLRAKTLSRMVFNEENKSIIYVEDILINKRIRDIVESPKGEIVLLTDQKGGADGYTEIPQIIFISKK